MQDESWYALVDATFPENNVTDYLRDEPRRHVILSEANHAPKHKQEITGSQREFLASLGHKRKPVGTR